MPALMLTVDGGDPFAISVGQYSRRFVYEREPEQNWFGDLNAFVTDYSGFLGAYGPMSTPFMPIAEARALRDLLKKAGSIVVDGPLIGEDVACHARGVSLEPAPYSTLEAAVSFELEDSKAVGADRREYLRVEMADATGALQDVTRFFVSGTITRSVEQMADTASLTFLRETREGSNNPLVVGPSGQFDTGRECRIRFAWHPIGETLSEDDWFYLYSGKVHAYDVGGKRPLMQFEGRDRMGRITKATIKTVRQYGGATVTSPQVIQAMLNDNLPAEGIVITDPDSIAQGILPFNQARAQLHSAIQEVANVSGAMFQAFIDDDGGPEFRLWQPDPTKTTPDTTFDVGDYFEVTRLEKSLDGVRNTAMGILREDEEGNLLTVTRQAVESDDPEEQCAIFDLRTTPLITTVQEAGAWLDVVLAELAFATRNLSARMPIRREVDIGRLLSWPADNIIAGDPLIGGVVSRTITLGPGGNEMVPQCAARVRGSRFRWSDQEARYRRKQEAEEEEAADVSQFVEFYFTTASGSQGFSVPSTASESLGGWVSTTPAPITLSGLFREVLEEERPAPGTTLYRSLGIVNHSDTFVVYLAVAFLGSLGEGGVTWSIQVDPKGPVPYQDSTIQSAVSADEETAPDTDPALVFVSPDSQLHEDVVVIGTIGPEEAAVIHIKLDVIDEGPAGQITDSSLVLQGFIPSE